MKSTRLVMLGCKSTVLFVTLFAVAARGQDMAVRGRLRDSAERIKPAAESLVAAAGPSVSVSKTAAVVGHEVCGVIRITNSSGQPLTVMSIADSLEVHFSRSQPASPLSPGSSSNWFKVGDVPISNPGSIAARTTANIEYCHSLCLTEDFAGANSMRNVVSVTVATASGNSRTFTTRSVSFPPPTLDCRACCMPDGSCTDTVSTDCTSAGGRAQAADTQCATTECPQACCHADDTCSDDAPSVCQNAGNEPKGPGTDCATTECCQPVGGGCGSFDDCCGENTECEENTCCIRLAESGCTTRSDCCDDEDFAVAICQDGRCCAPNGTRDSCHDTADCCDANATCNGGTCCIALGDTGCTSLFGGDCCETFGTAICQDGKCCAPNGAHESCGADTDCCDPNATCVLDGNDPGTCCIPIGNTGCDDSSDCCDDGAGTATCNGGKCCAPNGVFSSCTADTDCCDENDTCNLGGQCCIAIGDPGCTSSGQCCDVPGSTLVCGASGRCCGPTGFHSSCGADSDCCEPTATCDDGTCCVSLGASGCDSVSDCCDDRPGVSCTAEKCCVRTDIDFHSACSENTDCCDANATCNIHGACCFATGSTGCFSSLQCCDSGATCASGKCCAANGGPGTCNDRADCCDANAVCNLNHTCCLPDFRSCNTNSDCCSGLCSGGQCEGIISP